jgi:hypothetical protein
MSRDIDIIHHAGVITRDIDGAVARYERLGFQFAPLSLQSLVIHPGEPPVYSGIGNRSVLFRRNHFEIVAVADPGQWAQLPKAQRDPFDLDERKRLYDGLHIMHFGAGDMEVVRTRFKRDGVGLSGITSFQWEMDTPGGRRITQGKGVQFAKSANPEALIQIVQHDTPALALPTYYTAHPNGAQMLTACIVCGLNPENLAAKYGRYSGKPVNRSDGTYVINLGYSRVRVVDPEWLQRIVPDYAPPVLPFLAGFIVATTDLDLARQALRLGDVDYTDRGERLIVPPEAACGSAVLFEPAGMS